MKKRSFFLLFIFILGIPSVALSARAGDWGISANSAITNIENTMLIANSSGVAYTGVFYQFSDEISADLGFAYADFMRKDREREYFNSVYFKCIYNFGKGPVIPHVGFEYINAIGTDSNIVDYQTVSKNLIFGGEVQIIPGFSAIFDLRVLGNYSIEKKGMSEYMTTQNMMPVVSFRWYI